MTEQIKGVVAIFICKQGNIIESVADFDTGRPAGFDLKEAQSMRAKRALIGKVIRAYCSPALTDNISDYTFDCIFKDLINNGGKIRYDYIGHE